MRVHLDVWLAGLTAAFLVMVALVLIERGPLPADVGLLRGTQTLGVVPDPAASIVALTLLFGPPVVMLGFLVYKRMFAVALWFAAAVVSSILESGTLQLLSGRPGPPPLGTLTSQSTPSFPSVTVVEVMVQVALICYLGWKFSWAWRRQILALAIANVVISSVLVIDESAHWPSDVLGGLFFGGAWVMVALIVAKRWRRWRESLGVGV